MPSPSAAPRADPVVSIIISAYNRPRVIEFAIKSVLASDFDDWELIVVGDACNAATENAVRSFTDPRIRFHNLPENTGHQSAPHNKGVELARGEFVLFLNQDDMYFPDHISKRVAFMRKTNAEISWSPILLLQHSGFERGSVDVEKDRLVLDGAPPDGQFNPHCFIISSCWAIRREVCDKVGSWKPIKETRLSPSQEWLFRAHTQGRRMVYHPYVSVLCIHSGVRRYSYVSAHSFEHERAWTWLAGGPAEKLNLLHCVAVQGASRVMQLHLALEDRIHGVRGALERGLGRLGFHPHAVQRFLQRVTKGEWVSGHTRFTSSKPPPLPLDAPLSAGSAEAENFFGRGWHAGEGHNRWTSGEIAELFFTVPEQESSERNLMVELMGHPLRAGDTVSFTLNGGVPLSRTLGGAEVTAIALPGPGTYHLMIGVDEPTSPKNLGWSEDDRILGYSLTSIRIATATASPAPKTSRLDGEP